MSINDVIENVLAGSIKNADRRVELADEIIERLTEDGHLYEDGWIETVEVHHSRVITETIETYGLVIQLDAHGNAVTVNSPDGFMVIE